MNNEELEEYIFNYIHYEYPRLTLETIGNIAEIIFDGFEWWKEENLEIIERYIPNAINLQFGADSISYDKLGYFCLTVKGMANVLNMLKALVYQ